MPPFVEPESTASDAQAAKSLTDSAIDVQGHNEDTDESNGATNKEVSLENRRQSHSQTPMAGDSSARRKSSSSAVHKASTSGIPGANLRSASFDDRKYFHVHTIG